MSTDHVWCGVYSEDAGARFAITLSTAGEGIVQRVASVQGQDEPFNPERISSKTLLDVAKSARTGFTLHYFAEVPRTPSAKLIIEDISAGPSATNTAVANITRYGGDLWAASVDEESRYGPLAGKIGVFVVRMSGGSFQIARRK
jgi:hypothetical protein